MNNNIFTIHIHDIIIPDLVIPHTSKITKHNTPLPIITDSPISLPYLKSMSKSLTSPKKKHGNDAT